MTGWSLDLARAISDDGNVIVGTAFNPDGANQSWMVNISAVPLPPALWLFGTGLLGLIGIARRRMS